MRQFAPVFARSLTGPYIHVVMPLSLPRILFEPRRYPALILAASIGVLAGAFFFQHVVGLDPCVLCIWQRYPYVAAIALMLVAIYCLGAGGRGWLLGLCGLVFLAGAGIAFFHAGVEQHWWRGTAECAGGMAMGQGVADLMARAQAAQPARCDEIPWSLFGLSMAGYNVLISLALAAASLHAARRLIREQP